MIEELEDDEDRDRIDDVIELALLLITRWSHTPQSKAEVDALVENAFDTARVFYAVADRLEAFLDRRREDD